MTIKLFARFFGGEYVRFELNDNDTKNNTLLLVRSGTDAGIGFEMHRIVA